MDEKNTAKNTAKPGIPTPMTIGPSLECTGEELRNLADALLDLAEHMRQYHGWPGTISDIALRLTGEIAMPDVPGFKWFWRMAFSRIREREYPNDELAFTKEG